MMSRATALFIRLDPDFAAGDRHRALLARVAALLGRSEEELLAALSATAVP